MHHDDHCIFCKIVQRHIPSKLVYEDDEMMAFHDIHPWAPVHFLIIPKEHIASMAQLKDQHSALLGRMMIKVAELARQEGCLPYPQGGYRLMVNTGDHGGQEVHHLHLHVMGGPRPWAKG
jgi:histidine triad (HIT) family protein